MNIVSKCSEALLTVPCATEVVNHTLDVLKGAGLSIIAGEVFSMIQKTNDSESLYRNVHKHITAIGCIACISINKVHSSLLAGWLLSNIFLSSTLPLCNFIFNRTDSATDSIYDEKIKKYICLSFALGILTSCTLSFNLNESKVSLLTPYIAGNAVAYTVSFLAASYLRKQNTV